TGAAAGGRPRRRRRATPCGGGRATGPPAGHRAGWARQRARLQGGPRPGARGAGAAGARRHHQEGVVNRAISPGIYALLLTFVAGLWIVISPFVLEHSPAGSASTPEPVNKVPAAA